MLNIQEVINPNAVEKYICEPMHKLPKAEEMEVEDTKLLVGLLKASPNKKMAEIDKPFIFRMIEKRVNARLSVKITDHRLILFLCIICKTPCKAVLYLYYIQYWALKNNTEEITLELFGEKIFPFGFFKDKDLNTIWDAQKVKPNEYGGSDNLIDYPAAATSIQFQHQTA